VLGAGLAVVPAGAQDAAKKKEPPKAASESYPQHGGAMNDIAAEVDRHGGKTSLRTGTSSNRTGQRSFREGLLHVADVNLFLHQPGEGREPPAQEDFSKDQA